MYKDTGKGKAFFFQGRRLADEIGLAFGETVQLRLKNRKLLCVRSTRILWCVKQCPPRIENVLAFLKISARSNILFFIGGSSLCGLLSGCHSYHQDKNG